jgi:hypothetical protein
VILVQITAKGTSTFLLGLPFGLLHSQSAGRLGKPTQLEDWNNANPRDGFKSVRGLQKTFDGTFKKGVGPTLRTGERGEGSDK